MMHKLHMKLKQRWLPNIYARLLKGLIDLIGYTYKYQVEGIEHLVQSASHHKTILMFWHRKVTLITEILLRFAPEFNYAAMISHSRDGQIIAAITDAQKNGRAIRVPHDSKAAALQAIIRTLKYSKEVVIITPDGPKGPINKVKPGIAVAAEETGAQIVPMSWSCDRFWQLKTWDKMQFPKPFAKVTIKFGSPLKEIKESDTERLEEALLSLDI